MGINNPYTQYENNDFKELMKTAVKYDDDDRYNNNAEDAGYVPTYNFSDYSEVIVRGGGTFWQDAKHTKPGFSITSDYTDEDYPIYETYYSPN
jgi:hypothetical protein